jgi:ATP-dependent DNA helicase RecG
MMHLKKLKQKIAGGEDSRTQFKQDIRSVDSLAAEMAAFANSEGGAIYIGVADDSSTPGLSMKDVGRINQLISNASSQHIRSPLTVHTENVPMENNRVVIILTVPKGIDKPYFDRHGVIWLKTGADKRRINSKEELRRLFQSVDIFHADEVPTKAGIDKLDRIRFRDFLQDIYDMDLPERPDALLALLQNMNLACNEGTLNLAGVLLFSERPEWIKPEFIIKAVSYPGNNVAVTRYLDHEDISGPFKKMFENALAFIMRNIKKIQAGQNVNFPGEPEIPQIVFEELIVNALIHRDYFISAAIRIFIFDDRIEIISPGHLPNNLTIEKIRAGNSNIRNPILASFVSKKLMPYRGLGSGIRRVLEKWPEINFDDDRNGCTFKVIIFRPEIKDGPKPDGPGHDGPEQNGPESNGPGPKQNGPEPDGPKQDGPEPDGPKQNGPEQNGPESNGPGPKQNGPEPDGPKQNGPEQNGPKQNGPESNGPGPKQNGPEPDGPKQNGPEPDGPKQNGPEPDGPEPDGPEPDGPENINDIQIQILNYIRNNTDASYEDLIKVFRKGRSTIKRYIQKLKKAGVLQRVGATKTGHWKVLEYRSDWVQEKRRRS